MAEDEKAWTTSNRPPPNRSATVATIIIAIAVCPILIAMYARMEFLAKDLNEARADMSQLSQLNTSLKETLNRINEKLGPDTKKASPKEATPNRAPAGNAGVPIKELRGLAGRLRAAAEEAEQDGNGLYPDSARPLADTMDSVAEYLELWQSHKERGELGDKDYYRTRYKLRDEARKELSRFYSAMETEIKKVGKEKKEKEEKEKKKKKMKPEAVDEVF